jgi:hypothetical protein
LAGFSDGGILVSSDGITDCGAASLNSAATIVADDLVTNFASAAGAGNSARNFVSTVVPFSGHQQLSHSAL